MFHLAIPSKDIKESVEFYENLGFTIGRKYKGVAIMNFFGHQVVLHQSGEWDRSPKMYPRHFGIIVPTKKKLIDYWNRWGNAKFIFEDYFERFPGEVAEHHTFFIKDPSNNLVEFKWYKNERAIF